MNLNAVIIDDELNSTDVLKILISKHCPCVTVVGHAEDAVTGESIITSCAPDIVFLDIEMPARSGFDMLDKVACKDFEVIFVTAYDHYALKAIKHCALDYLLKPVDIDELVGAVQKVAKRRRHRHTAEPTGMLTRHLSHGRIAIPVTDGLEFVEIQQVIRCEASGNYTKMYLSGHRSYLIARSLKEYETLLAQHNFVRIHNAHLVNLNHVQKYTRGEGGYAVMTDGAMVDISKRKKQEFLSHFTRNS